MSKVTFTYPGTDRKILDDVSIYCSLSTRVAIHGPNGAGKSTLIKIMCGVCPGRPPLPQCCLPACSPPPPFPLCVCLASSRPDGR